MSDAFAAAAAVLAADANLGADGIYTPQGEAPLAVRVVLSRREEMIGGANMIAAGWDAMVPTSAILDRPRKGEALSVGGRDFTVEEVEKDESGASWRLVLRKVGTWL